MTSKKLISQNEKIIMKFCVPGILDKLRVRNRVQAATVYYLGIKSTNSGD